MQGAVLPKAQEMPVPKISTIKNVLSIGIFLAVVCYSAIYANNTFPISEGWNVNYVELIWHGKVPYRDFYYYLPPLNLLVDAVLWKLSFGSLLLYRLWWLLQRATIFTLLFRLISRYINVVSTFVACLFSVMLCASSVYDLLGDYNQTVALLSILLLYCVIGFQEADTSKQRYTKIFGAGFMLGLVFLNKQTIFLASGIVYFAALAFYCIRKKDARFGWYCLFVVAGAVIPLAVAAAYLLANGAFFPFVEQVFMHTGGKGSIFTILFGGLSMALLKVQNWLIAVAAVLLAVNTGVSASREKALRAQSLLFPLLLLLLYVNFEKEISSFLELLGKSPEMQAILLIDAVLTALLLYLCVKRKVRGSRVMLPAGSILLLLFTWAATFVFCGGANSGNSDFLHDLYRGTDVWQAVQDKLYFVVLLLTIVQLVRYGARVGSQGENSQAEGMFWLFCAALATMYSGIMSSGTSSIPYFCTMVAVPAVLATVLSFCGVDAWIELAVRGIAIVGCIVLSITCMAQKVICSYAWWGTEEKPRNYKTYSTDIPALKGFKFSKEDKEMFEGITQLIEENTTEDSVIFGYPYVKIFNILTDNYNMNTFVPVLFYDVVDDKYVQEEKALLEEKLPDIVVWKDIPDCKEVHERAFRDGKPLEQRKIEDMFAELLPTQYEQLGEFDDVTVYKLRDKASQIEFALDGEGTYEDPYRIENAADLLHFAELVSDGMTFKGQYVEQIADIDLDGQNMQPIGDVENEHCFYGVYNGAGHVIRNLNLKQSNSENVGLFSCLGGQVYNLGLEGGTIRGKYAGAIAGGSVGKEARIVNCYTDVAVTATRAGGIANDFDGRIFNCVSVGTLTGQQSAAAISGSENAWEEEIYQLQGSGKSAFETPSQQGQDIAYGDAEAINGDYLVRQLSDNAKEENKKNRDEDEVTHLLTWQKGNDGHPVFKKTK